MAGDKVTYEVASKSLLVAGRHRIPLNYYDSFYAPLDWVGNVLLSSLIRASVGFARQFSGWPLQLHLTAAAEALFIKTPPAPDIVSLEANAAGVDLKVSGHLFSGGPNDPSEVEAVLRHLLEPVIEPHRVEISELWVEPVSGGDWRVKARLAFPWQRYRVIDAHATGRLIQDTLFRPWPTGTPEGTRRLIDAALPGSLVGQAESAWLEVKNQPYRLNTDEERFDREGCRRAG